jgi:hypothetical protein
MAIVPDDKDWTWVIDRPCPQCGYDSAGTDPASLPARIAAVTAAWQELLSGPDVRARPDDATWSVLEYACHVRDVHRVYRGRVERMLEEDDPFYESWDQDATAIADGYGDQDPVVVGIELADAGAAVAARFASVRGDAWQRTGRRSDGARFTIDTIGRYYLHDIEHHLWDTAGRRPEH